MIKLKPIRKNEKIGIAIPTKNRHVYLAALLASLAHQTYTNWMLVINDSSDQAVEENDSLNELFTLIRNKGHKIKIIHTKSGWDRHQRAMEAVPESVEFILRVDDDMVLTPRFIEKVLRPFRFFPDQPLAATGGCYPTTSMKAIDIDKSLKNPLWAIKISAKNWMTDSWRLQGHCYNKSQIIEVESLLGHAICYRRSAIKKVGGWAVKGYSNHAFKEESDLCARLTAKGYGFMVNTEALAWHLVALGGGSREIIKTKIGNFMLSDRKESESDIKLFKKRLSRLIMSGIPHKDLKRYNINDLEKNMYKGYPLVVPKGKKTTAK